MSENILNILNKCKSPVLTACAKLCLGLMVAVSAIGPMTSVYGMMDPKENEEAKKAQDWYQPEGENNKEGRAFFDSLPNYNQEQKIEKPFLNENEKKEAPLNLLENESLSNKSDCKTLKIDISNYDVFNDIKSHKEYEGVESISFDFASNFGGNLEFKDVDFMQLESLKNLKRITILGAKGLYKLETLKWPKDLRELICDKCDDLENLDGIEVCEHLESVSFEDCTALKSIDQLPKNTNIKHVNISGCSCSVEDLQKDWPNLESLEVDCYNLTTLPDGKNYPALKRLVLPSSQIKDFSGLSEYKKLKEVCISRTDLTNLDFLANCPWIECVDVSCNENLKDFSGLKNCTSLKDINISNNKGLKNLGFLKNCPWIERLDVSNNKNLKDFNGLKNCINLKFIDISYNENLTSLNGFEKCILLERLNASGNHNLKDIKALERCIALNNVNLANDFEIECVALLGINLQRINLTNTHFPLDQFKTLVSGCANIEEINLSGNGKQVDDTWLPFIESMQTLKKVHLRGNSMGEIELDKFAEGKKFSVE